MDFIQHKPRKTGLALPIITALFIGLVNQAYAQGSTLLVNVSNTSTNTTALTNGLFWIQTNGASAVLLDKDFNAAFYAGPTPTNLTLLAQFLLSDGTATGDNPTYGGFFDPAAKSRSISGVTNVAYFKIQAWLGSYSSYSNATAAGVFAGQSAAFTNAAECPPAVPSLLSWMPAIVLTGTNGAGPSSPIGPGGQPWTGNLGGTGSGPLTPSGSSTCGLELSVTTSNTIATLMLTGTRPGQTYYISSAQTVNTSLSSWVLETNITGATGNQTQTKIAMGSRSNLFFSASEYRNYVTNLVFQGLNYSNAPFFAADVMAAVGPNHVVELLNGIIAVYDKSGVLLATNSMTNFFSLSYGGTNYPTGSSITDPRLLYDSASQCWVASALDVPVSGLGGQAILAVCTNQNPTNVNTGWTRYVIPVQQAGANSDFDTLGLDANGIYISVLHRISNTNSGHAVVAIKKPDIYSGNCVTSVLTNNNDLTLWTLQPAVNFDSVPANGYVWFVAKGPPTLSGSYQGGDIMYRRLQWTGTNAAWADPNWSNVSSSVNYQDYYDFDGTNTTVVPSSGISAPQQNGTTPLWKVGSRLAMTCVRNGFLWTCHAVGFAGTTGTYTGDSSGSSVDRSAIQWFQFQIAPDSSSLALANHGRVFDSTSSNNPWWYHFPSLMVNCAGDMLAGFSGSSATNYIGAFYTWRLAGGATLSQPILIQSGAITVSENIQWGDYSTTTLDPGDDWTFWTVQEYATPWIAPRGTTNGYWGTVVSRLKPNP
jgi:hypothetical protein